MSLTGSRFSSDSALRPFHHGIRRRRGTIFSSTLRRQVEVENRTQRIHRPARDIIPPLGGSRFPPIGFDPAKLSSRCDFWNIERQFTQLVRTLVSAKGLRSKCMLASATSSAGGDLR